MIWTKGAHQKAKFYIFNCSRKISPNLFFDRFLNVYKILAKKVQRSYVSWPWILMQNLKKNWCVVSKMTRTWRNLKVSKMCTFICSYCAKYSMFDLKKYRRVIFHDIEKWSKIWRRKSDLWFGKWHKEYDTFSPEHLKVSKLGLWWDP